MQVYKRIALIGAIANPNVGDEAIVEANLQKIRKMYGENCKIYVFTKDAAYTSFYTGGDGKIIPVDYLHRFTIECGYNVDLMKKRMEGLIDFSEKNKKTVVEYDAIHTIMKEIDVLHIVGGGYLNSIWPDILYEVLILTRLAKRYHKKYCLTGISIYPLNIENLPEIKEILSGAEFADFRDDSYLQYDLQNICNCVETIDDAVYMDDYYDNLKNEMYATIAFHDWNDKTKEIIKLIQGSLIPFMEQCLREGIVQYFYILYFSTDDMDIWNSVKFENEVLVKKIKQVDSFNQNCIYTKHLVANAKFNIGSRFHQAVFSLSACVPVLSISYDDYYNNKLKYIHNQFHSESVVSISDADQKMFDEFKNNLDANVLGNTCIDKNIKNLYEEKNKRISEVYGLNRVDSDQLYMRLNGEYSQPKISVIIPIYNMDAYLRECLDSVLCQSINDIEVICIDDGSTDYTQLILAEYAWKDSRIKVISQTNHGVAFARNAGIRKSTGEFLFFLDPDDWLPDKDVFLDLYNAAKTNKVLICGGNFREHAVNGIVDSWGGNLCKYTFIKDELMNYSDYQFDYGWVRFIYNRDFIIYNNLYIPELTFFEDPVFFVKVMHQAKTFYCLNRCTYCYRTGYKSLELSYSKVIDLMKGLFMNIQFAKTHDYQQLLALELSRIENDFSEFIVKYLMSKDSTQLREIFDELNLLLYNGDNKIEYRMYNKLLTRKDFDCWNIQQRESDCQRRVVELEENRKMFYNSTTWKVGNLILFIPKLVKKFLCRR